MILWRRDSLLTPVFLDFPCGLAGKESACNVGDLGLIPELGRSPGEGKGYPLQYSDLENSMDCCKESDMTELPSLSLSEVSESDFGEGNQAVFSSPSQIRELSGKNRLWDRSEGGLCDCKVKVNMLVSRSC